MTFGKRLAAALAIAISAAPLAASADDATPSKRVKGYVMVGGVNVRNGNFSLTYAAFEAGQGVPYRRTYNSLATNAGVFGLGWGSTFDTRLIVLPGGRVVVRENGNGALAVYGRGPANEAPADLERKVVAAEPRRGGHWRPRLGKIRLDRAKALQVQACDEAAITWTWSGWTRVTCSGLQRFDAQGRLVAYQERAAGPVLIAREQGAIQRVWTPGGGSLAFSRSADALKVTDPKGGEVIYRFDPRGRNVRMEGASAATMDFGYDAASNMTDIVFIDTTRIRVTYDDQGRVAHKVERDGEDLAFDYRGGSTLVTRRRGEQAEAVLYQFDP